MRPKREAQQNFEVCKKCRFFDADACGDDGAKLRQGETYLGKIRWATERCSNGYWEREPVKAPSTQHMHAQDHARLRHARARNVGFPVGRYIQAPPMIFTRDGHNVPLADMYRGRSMFLVCGGPSLTKMPLDRLDASGVLTMGVNNAAVVYRPNLWVSVDDPTHFCDVIWQDPGITKFTPLCHMEKSVWSRDESGKLVETMQHVGDMPAVFGYRRNEDFQPDQWLYEDSFNWGNHASLTDSLGNAGSRSVFYIALRLTFFLGVRKLFLLGCDFRMENGKQNYAFVQDRAKGSVKGNNTSYDVLNQRLELLLPHFDREGFEVVNCTPGSGLTVFPAMDVNDALDAVTANMPQRTDTAGLYDGKAKE